MSRPHEVIIRYATFITLVLVAFFGVLYLSTHTEGTKASNSLSIDTQGACKDTAGIRTTNPNKFLFISCGVFLD